jgi:hypothetical protein
VILTLRVSPLIFGCGKLSLDSTLDDHVSVCANETTCSADDGVCVATLATFGAAAREAISAWQSNMAAEIASKRK